MLLILVCIAFYSFFRPDDSSNENRGISIEQTDNTCSVYSKGWGSNRLWILENNHLKVSINANTAQIMEILTLDSNVRHLSDTDKKPNRYFGYFPVIKGQIKNPPDLTSIDGTSGEEVWVKFYGKKFGIYQEIYIKLKPNAHSIQIAYKVSNETENPSKGDFIFSLNGKMGDELKDDMILIPAKGGGLRRLDVSKGSEYCSVDYHFFRNWFGSIDNESKEMLVLSLPISDDEQESTIYADLNITGYRFGLARHRMTLKKQESANINFSLFALNRDRTDLISDVPWKEEAIRLFGNLDLISATPSGSGRLLSASFGLATTEIDRLNEKNMEVDAKVKINIRLNRYSTSEKVSLTTGIDVKTHSAQSSEPIFSQEQPVSLGGWFQSNEKTVSFTIDRKLLSHGRYDVFLIVRDRRLILTDRLNLGGFCRKIDLPAPAMKTGFPVERVIARRMSQRVFSDEMIPLEQLSYILYYCAGLIKDNDKTAKTPMITHKRTTPGKYEVFVYFRHENIVYHYDKLLHKLIFHQQGGHSSISEFEEEDILASSSIRADIAPIDIIIADDGGASNSFFQSIQLASAALNIGACIYDDEKHPWFKLPKGYIKLHSVSLGKPFTPFVFKPNLRADDPPGKRTPLVDESWNKRGLYLAEKYKGAKREPEMSAIKPNLGGILEHALTFEEAVKKGIQTSSFKKDLLLKPWEKYQFLWAAYGRSYLKENQESRDYFDDRRLMFVPGGVHRTAPSAHGKYPFDIYVMDESGLYQYFGKRHYLHLLSEGDYRDQLIKLSNAPFENPSVLYLFSRRDAKFKAPPETLYDEAYFSAQNMLLTGAAMDIAIDIALIKWNKGALPIWKEILASAEEVSKSPVVGRGSNLANKLPLPGAIIAVGRTTKKDIRLHSYAEYTATAFKPYKVEEKAD